MDLEHRVLDFCNRHGLFMDLQDGTVLAALSGGGDSVALVVLLCNLADRLGIRVAAAHLNHGLRGAEADADEAYCREFCGARGIPLITARLEPGDLPSGSEVAARDARLLFLERTAAEVGACRIATGHTADDQAETVMMHILRGTGPAGLAGINPVRDGVWVRPLLGIRRGELREWLAARGISWREDASNRDTRFFRNRIRHNLLPLLREEYAPGIDAALGRLADLSRVQESYLDGEVERALEGCLLYGDGRKILLENQRFDAYHEVLKQRIIRRVLERLDGPGRDTDSEEIARVLACLDRPSTTATLSAGIRIGTGGGVAVFMMWAKPAGPVPLATPGITAVPDGGTIVVEQAPADAVVDGCTAVFLDPALAGRYGPFTVGALRRGEAMIPFGMDRPVNIRDIAAAAELPRVLRDGLPVVRAGAVPLWAPGLRAAEALRLPTDVCGRPGTAGVMIARASGWFSAWCRERTDRA